MGTSWVIFKNDYFDFNGSFRDKYKYSDHVLDFISLDVLGRVDVWVTQLGPCTFFMLFPYLKHSRKG